MFSPCFSAYVKGTDARRYGLYTIVTLVCQGCDWTLMFTPEDYVKSSDQDHDAMEEQDPGFGS